MRRRLPFQWQDVKLGSFMSSDIIIIKRFGDLSVKSFIKRLQRVLPMPNRIYSIYIHGKKKTKVQWTMILTPGLPLLLAHQIQGRCRFAQFSLNSWTNPPIVWDSQIKNGYWYIQPHEGFVFWETTKRKIQRYSWPVSRSGHPGRRT